MLCGSPLMCAFNLFTEDFTRMKNIDVMITIFFVAYLKKTSNRRISKNVILL